MLSNFVNPLITADGDANMEMPYIVDNTMVYGKEGSSATKKSSIPISTLGPMPQFHLLLEENYHQYV
jgi:hypothetical protein